MSLTDPAQRIVRPSASRTLMPRNRVQRYVAVGVADAILAVMGLLVDAGLPLQLIGEALRIVGVKPAASAVQPSRRDCGWSHAGIDADDAQRALGDIHAVVDDVPIEDAVVRAGHGQRKTLFAAAQ